MTATTPERVPALLRVPRTQPQFLPSTTDPPLEVWQCGGAPNGKRSAPHMVSAFAGVQPTAKASRSSRNVVSGSSWRRTERGMPSTARTSPNGVGGSRIGPASGGRSSPAMATVPTWTRFSGSSDGSAQDCPRAPERSGFRVCVNPLQDVARRETGRGSRPARRPRPRRRICPSGLWEPRDSATRGACSMAWALADFRRSHSDCASGPLATLRGALWSNGGLGSNGRLAQKGSSAGPQRRSFVTFAATLDSGAVDPTSGSEGRMPTDKWIVRDSEGIGQRKPRSVVA